jgi:hypothetical protein
MQSPTMFIVEPKGGKRYANTTDDGLIVSVSQEDAKSSNRIAIVRAVPINYDGPVEVGDCLLVHHNVFKLYYDMRGRERSGRSHFYDNLFFVDDQQYFAYRKGGYWFSPSPFCFVRPIPAKEYYIEKFTDSEPLVGEMVYTNEELIRQGVFAGSQVCFTPESEYEFRVDGEVLYRMRTNDIAILLDEQQTTQA